MKNFKLMLILTGLITASVASSAASHAGAPMAKDDAKKTMPTAAAVDMVEGEVRKVDKENKKITLKHGAIRNLDMPAMTMVFGIKDAAMLDNLKAGDKVKFKAEQAGGAIVVTDIRMAK